MNLWPAVRDGDALGAGPFTLPGRVAPDGGVEAGIRPEHLELVAAGAPCTVDADVELVEGTADSALAHVVAGGHRLIARLAADAPWRRGDRVGVRAPLERWFLFDAASGATVRWAS